MSSFFCAWIPQFPAWALAQSEAALRGRAFAVCQSGRVVAASPQALDAGVPVGARSARAHAHCPQLLIVGRDPAREALAWAQVERAFYGLTPRVESVEPGTLFAQVEAGQTLPLLRAWGARGGAASDRASAHLAALGAPAGRARSVKRGGEKRFLDQTPLALLAEAGVSTRTLRRLKWFGWPHVGALRALSRRQLEEQVGEEGALLFRYAQGAKARANLRPVATWQPPASVSAAMSFEWPAREPCEWEGALDELLRRVCADLGAASAQTIEVEAQTPLAPVVARRVLREPLHEARALGVPARRAPDEALRTLSPLPPVVLGLEVHLSALCVPPAQASLFAGDKDEKFERPQRLRRALENMETRFAGALGVFTPAEPDSPFPEDAYLWLPALEAVKSERAQEPKKARR